jgi:hypothetical protein
MIIEGNANNIEQRAFETIKHSDHIWFVERVLCNLSCKFGSRWRVALRNE